MARIEVKIPETNLFVVLPPKYEELFRSAAGKGKRGKKGYSGITMLAITAANYLASQPIYSETLEPLRKKGKVAIFDIAKALIREGYFTSLSGFFRIAIIFYINSMAGIVKPDERPRRTVKVAEKEVVEEIAKEIGEEAVVKGELSEKEHSLFEELCERLPEQATRRDMDEFLHFRAKDYGGLKELKGYLEKIINAGYVKEVIRGKWMYYKIRRELLNK